MEHNAKCHPPMLPALVYWLSAFIMVFKVRICLVEQTSAASFTYYTVNTLYNWYASNRMQFHTKKEGELGLKEQEIVKERNFLIEYSMGRVRTTLLYISLYGNRVGSSYSPAWSSVTNKAQTLPVTKTAAKYVLKLKLLLLSYNTNIIITYTWKHLHVISMSAVPV